MHYEWGFEGTWAKAAMRAAQEEAKRRHFEERARQRPTTYMAIVVSTFRRLGFDFEAPPIRK